MKDYELTVLFHPDLEMNLDPAVDKVKKTIEAAGGKITKESNEGKKHLSYAIQGQNFAVFYYFDVAFPPEAPGKVGGIFNITDEILRYLLVKADARKAKAEAIRATKPAEASDKPAKSSEPADKASKSDTAAQDKSTKSEEKGE